MQSFKSPIEQSNAILADNKHPFDIDHIDRKGGTAAQKFDKARLINLTADEYYKLVANEGGAKLGGVENTDWKKLMENRAKVPNEMSVEDMEKLMRSGAKFPAAWIHMYDKLGSKPYFQEGLHRMLAAKNVYGENAKFPVWLGLDSDSQETYDDIDKGNIDEFIQSMNERRRQRQTDYDNAQWEEEQRLNESYRKMTARWMKKPIEEVTDEDIKKYQKYEDWLFKEEWNE